MDKIDVAAKLALVHDYWTPHIIAELNGQHVKVVKLKGEFVWHRHEHEDELFYVLDGRLVIELRDGAITLDRGELCVVPRGVEHRPVAADEVHVLLFEPAGTRNTGNVENDRTVPEPRRI